MAGDSLLFSAFCDGPLQFLFLRRNGVSAQMMDELRAHGHELADHGYDRHPIGEVDGERPPFHLNRAQLVVHRQIRKRFEPSPWSVVP